MALKKSQLYSSLWQSCDELRGGMDASQYKDYVLTLLFMKYVSDKYAGKPDALIEVPEGGSFADMVKLKGDDLLGDAYEYLMRHFATESGKSKGQFYTPAEVSRIMAKVVGIGPATRQDQSIYDPTCGSGSLLLKAADEAPNGITIYGQEMDVATGALARMNMILHGHPTAELWRGNTLADPHFKNEDDSLKTFDYSVANPPFSTKSWSNGLDPLHDEFNRSSLACRRPRMVTSPSCCT
jgi:type I restriction-modification system DNA methylase subunit